MAKKKLTKTVKVSIVVILAAVLTVTAFILYQEYDYRFTRAVLKDANLKIYPGMSFWEVVAKLEEQKVIKSAKQMTNYAIQHERDTVMVGNYELKQGESYRTILGDIAFGRQTPIKLTFNNFRTVDRLVGAVAKRTLSDSNDYMKIMRNDSLLKAKGFTKETLISMFIPNTYEVYWTITPKEFFEKMYDEYDNFWGYVRRSKAENLGYTPAQISVIASIVDSETNKKDEMSDVAGVYINRLRKGMPLQADPTVKFALGNFGLRRILFKHLRVDSPYNTYKYAGLPPGPICMSSIAAIDATLDYDGHDYLYFCARADFSGYHAFAKNMSEHSKNAREYQRELNKRNIK